MAAWLATVCDLMVEHLDEMPHQVVFDQLMGTFSLTAVAHSTADAAGRQTLLTFPRDVLRPIVELDEWTRGELRGEHPLVRWHVTTGDLRPTTIGRVPTTVVPSRDRARLQSSARRVDLDQQLAINVRLAGHAFSTYVLGRTASDFTDEDLVVAHQVQSALQALDRQVELLRRLRGLNGLPFDVGLTGRETTVLGLVAAGLTTRAVAHQLHCSPRTVEKHLERIYRKLGVRDRLNAVRVAQLWALPGTELVSRLAPERQGDLPAPPPTSADPSGRW